jgi:hypothetical protein
VFAVPREEFSGGLVEVTPVNFDIWHRVETRPIDTAMSKAPSSTGNSQGVGSSGSVIQ